MKDRNSIIVIFILALFIRLCFLSTPKIIDSDGVIYTRLAGSLMSGNGFIGLDGTKSTIVRPLYPIFIGIIDKIIKNIELSGRIISIFFGSLMPVIIFLISKEIFGKKESFLAAILVSMSPILASTSTGVMTETLFMFVIGVGILYLYSALKRGRNFNFFISGIIWGLPYLIRPEGISYLLVCVGMILFFNPEKISLRYRWIFVSFFLLGVFIPVLPLFVYLRISFGHWIISPEIYYLNPIEPAVYLRNLYYSAYIEQIPRIFTPLLIVFFGIGQFRSIFAEGKIRENVYLLSFVLYPFIIYPWNSETTISWRHYTIILPLLYIWVAKGIAEPARWLSEGANKRNVKLLVTISLAVLVFADFMPRLSASFRKKDPYLECPLEYKFTGEWIKNNVGKDKAIISRIREIAFYGGVRGFGIPKELKDCKQLVAFAKDRKIDYLVVDRRWTARLYPYLSVLLEDKNTPADLKLVYSWDKRPEYQVKVFKIIY